MININNSKDCCGCTACANICSHNAITMTPDKLGFLYPKVNKDICVECGLCEKVCAFNDSYDISDNLDSPNAYAVRHRNIEEVMNSRSGGAFVVISDFVLEQGGVVYGAGYGEHFRIVHKRATTKEERDEFRGSKYVQSDLGYIYGEIKKDLKEDKLVLFSGTPCQTAGLHSFIGKKLRENLILLDIVCHGVPSPTIWQDFLRYLEDKEDAEITDVNFRDKRKFGWSAHHETFRFSKKSGYKLYPWYNDVMYRHSCYNCHYCKTKRPSDFTLADFWGWDKVDHLINIDDKGCNLLLVNSIKAREIFEKVKNNFYVISTEINNCLQPQLLHPTEISPDRKGFETDYLKYGFTYVYEKYMKKNSSNPYKSLLKFRLRGLIPNRLILLIKSQKIK